ncbi:MAG: BBP7 family outer membrane beta-barrel protein [Planctomyces sp.]|nr:BBP7 family outer membrane beta-barrel protein [Planctomyces sp.]
MLRPNLLSLATALVIFSSIASNARAQYGPPQGGYQHQPLIQLPQSTYQAPIVDHYVQQPPRLWDSEQPIEKFLTEVTRRSWIKVEYLHWDFDVAGGDTLGAPVNGIRDLSDTFEGFDNLNGGASVGETLIPTTTSLGISDASGVRGTWGLHLNGGEMEMNFFGTEQADGSYDIRNIAAFRPAATPAIGTAIRPNYAIPLLLNGVPGDTSNLNAIIIDDSLSIGMSSQIWGAEVTLLTDAYLPGEGFKWQWLGGFRYVSLDESFNLRGVYNNGGADPDRITSINSSAVNNVYGPEIGARASLVHRWFTLAATPRVTFGLNDYTTHLQEDALGAGVTNSSTSEEIDFSTITQLNLTGEVHVNTHLSFYAGYDFMWMPRVSRPNTNIRYDSTNSAAGGFVTNIGLVPELENFIVEGVSLGAVFRY